MLDFGDIKKTIINNNIEKKKELYNLRIIAKETERVNNICKNSTFVINNIDRKFEQATKLTSIDVSFLFLAVALQVVRQYFFTGFLERSGHNEAAKEAKEIENNRLKNIEVDGNRIVNDKDSRMNATHKWYHPSIEEVTFNPVPYDQTAGIEGLGGGFEHRARTPGHDAILGYIFGTANIATATLTAWNMQSFHIHYGILGNRTSLTPMATHYAVTNKVFENAIKRLIDEDLEGKAIIAISLFREAMHLKSDVGSKESLPVPIITTISPDIAKEIAKYGLDVANIATIGKQVIYSTLINTIIGMLHRIIYDYNNPGSLSLYEVRTRKILTYSNLLSSASNIITVAFTKDMTKLDIGGFIVTLHRLITDTIFIGKIKQEFLEKEFYNVVIGDDYDF